jgi:predicted ATP-grasp superfamily ATP-dependent carboligase
MVRVDNLEQMIAAYREAADAGLETMLQEFIPGGAAAGINYNSYFWDGRPLVDFTGEKVRNAPPQYGSPRVAVSKRIPEVLEPACRLLKAMDFYGFSCAEFKRDSRDGIYKLMEVNGRHNRSGMLALRCGINFPWIQYQHLVFGHQPDACDFETGVYWMDFFRDLSYSLKSFRQEGYSLGEYLLPYRRPHVDALYDRDDPRPFFRRAANLVKRGL